MNKDKVSAIKLAVIFHETYERLAPKFGYETRKETKVFNASTPNGKLMIEVCREMQDYMLSKLQALEKPKSVCDDCPEVCKSTSIRPECPLKPVDDKALDLENIKNFLDDKKIRVFYSGESVKCDYVDARITGKTARDLAKELSKQFGTKAIPSVELEQERYNTQMKIEKLSSQLDEGRNYLMEVEQNKITVENTLEAFGFGRDGLQ